MKNDNPIYGKIKNLLADRFSNAIVKTHKTQAEIARCCGISRQTLQKYMRGANTIPNRITKIISELSNTELGYLLGEDILKSQEGGNNT